MNQPADKASYRKKLIEVALPLEAINSRSAEEKAVPRRGHPQTIHLWWARRPLAACRAVIFASLVDDPGEYMPDEEAATAERQRLFRLIEQLVKWDNINDERLFAEARLEIARSVARNLGVAVPIGEAAVRDFLAEKAPPVLDPFCGGGSIPLEAQRLGLRAYGSDLNPVAVLITKALIEIPPKFADRPPVYLVEEGNDGKRGKKGKAGQMRLPTESAEWKGAAGLADDLRHNGRWILDEVQRRIGHLYPKARLPKQYGGGEATVLAWLWARTARCPNPVCGARMPLVRSFTIVNRKSKKVWVVPIVDKAKKEVHFDVKDGDGTIPDGTVNRRGVRCCVCGETTPLDYIRAEGQAGRISKQLMAMFVQTSNGRVYLGPSEEQTRVAETAQYSWAPGTDLPDQALGFRVQLYGLKRHSDLFTSRQLAVLSTFCELIQEACENVHRDTISRYPLDDSTSVNSGGIQFPAYPAALSAYLGCALSRLVSYNNMNCAWNVKGGSVAQIFTRQTISMSWDFLEINPLAPMSGNWEGAIEWVSDVLDNLPAKPPGVVWLQDAAQAMPPVPSASLIVTDPPYYDNIGYADLSDFFYVWLRACLGGYWPTLFSTVLTPKSQELIADQHRRGGHDNARRFFEQGLQSAFTNIHASQRHEYPTVVYYAFKQAETDQDTDENNSTPDPVTASTGWETMLEGLIGSQFTVTGTWPMRTERGSRMRSIDSNALASSIALVCRPRRDDALVATRREFIAALKRELPQALRQLQQGAIAPVDLAQAVIGPGMAVFSRFKQVLEADGLPMRVRTALGLINQSLDEFLAEQEGEFDSDTRWALAWFEQYAHDTGPFGDAETLSKAKNTSVDGLARAGVLEARAGKVRLLRRDELDPDWTPETDERRTVWESAQHLVQVLDQDGEQAAADLLRRLGDTGQAVRDLAYRLYSVCERKGWAQEALAYNMLAAAWPRLVELAGRGEVRQANLL